MDISFLYMQPEGRIGRQTYWIAAIVLGVISGVVSIVLGMIFRANLVALAIATIIWQLIVTYPAYNLLSKRFHDRDKPSSYALGVVIFFLAYTVLQAFGFLGNPAEPGPLYIVGSLVVLVVAIWLLIELGFLRGTVGQNQYGPDPVAT